MTNDITGNKADIFIVDDVVAEEAQAATEAPTNDTAKAVLASFPITTRKGQVFLAGSPRNNHQRRCQEAIMRRAAKKTRKLLAKGVACAN